MTALLDGRAVVVTGAGAGVGRGIAVAMAAQGARVLIAARRPETGEPVAQEIREAGGEAVCARCDITRRDAIDYAMFSALRAFGQVDCVVHNALAQVGSGFAPQDWTLDHWEAMRATAVRASFDLAQAAYPHLRQQPGASFVLVSSSAGVEGSAFHPVYSMVKAAQRGLAKSLAREWAPDDIRVNCIAPVAMTESLERTFSDHPDLAERVVGRTPLGRMGDPATDIGPAVAFLASDMARYVTGQTLVVDGGGFMGL